MYPIHRLQYPSNTFGVSDLEVGPVCEWDMGSIGFAPTGRIDAFLA